MAGKGKKVGTVQMEESAEKAWGKGLFQANEAGQEEWGGTFESFEKNGLLCYNCDDISGLVNKEHERED
ncbi:MAG: hypothetical protein N2595_10080 [bacterium]|nr:hypothetical protein [bacterium]